MKKSIFSALLVVYSLHSFSQAWTAQNSGTTQVVALMSFVSDSIGYAVGNSGLCLKTIDGGTTWSSVSTGVSTDLTDVHFFDANNGYISGRSGVLLKTTNGGTSFTTLSPGGVTSDLTRIETVDNDIYISGYNGVMIKSSDGGTTWDSLTTGTTSPLFESYFIDADTGFVAGNDGTILKTTDAGMTWTPKNSGTSMQLLSITFTSPTTGFAVGGNGWSTNTGSIVKTTDGGNTWTEQLISNNYFGTVKFLDQNTGYVVGGNVTANTSTILKTIDGGVNWVIDSTSANRLFGSAFPSANVGYTCGLNGTILRKTLTNPACSLNIDLGPDITTCFYWILNAGVGNATYLWSTAATSQAIPIYSSGTYYVTVDSMGCVGSDTINVTIEDQSIFLGGDTTICENVSHVLDAGPGFTDYLWNTGAVSQTITVQPSPDNAEYSVIGWFGMSACSISDTIYIARTICNGVNEASVNKMLTVDPNPSSGIVNIHYNGALLSDAVIEIRNMAGQLIFAEKAKQVHKGFSKQINLKGYSKGIYSISIKSATTNHFEKLVIQ